MLKKVLIVEDSLTEQTILKSAFSSAEFEIDCVENNTSAWQLLKGSSPKYSLIVASTTGLNDEPEAFSLNLRTSNQYIHTPLILITPQNSDSDPAYYAVGYTQVYSREEIGVFKDYIQQRLSQGASSNESKYLAILIEDDRPQQLIIEAILGENHCDCLCYTSAEKALENIETLSPDIILVDFFLAGRMTGMKFINQIKSANHPWNKVPILALTGLDDPARKHEFLRAGANDYMVKPLQNLDVSVRVENLLKYKQLLDTVEEQRKEMQYLAMHDQLTGLHNRHFMASQVNGRINEAIRHNVPYSIIMMDIDYFKKVNDSWGHDMGDKVLICVAKTLLEQSRSEDIVARIGGEEFVVLLGYCDLDNALNKAELLRKAIEELKPAGLEVTASFGVAQLSTKNNTFDTLFKAADEAVYRAKDAGRNRVEKG